MKRRPRKLCGICGRSRATLRLGQWTLHVECVVRMVASPEMHDAKRWQRSERVAAGVTADALRVVGKVAAALGVSKRQPMRLVQSDCLDEIRRLHDGEGLVHVWFYEMREDYRDGEYDCTCAPKDPCALHRVAAFLGEVVP